MEKKLKDFREHVRQSIDALNLTGTPTPVGISWFRPETYDACLSIFDDADQLHDTYADWLECAEEVEEQAIRRGMRVFRVDIDPTTFPKWCTANGYTKIDKHARTAYSSLIALESVKASS